MGQKQEKKKRNYPWWSYVKYIVREYIFMPLKQDMESENVAMMEYEAVYNAIKQTEKMEDGQSRLKLIHMLHWDKTHTLEGAAMSIPCSRRTAAYWQRDFFEIVARNRGLLD